MLPVVEEFVREYLAIVVELSLTGGHVLSILECPFGARGERGFSRSEVCHRIGAVLDGRGAKTPYTAPERSRGNASSESFHSRQRDELPHRDLFEALKEAKVILKGHRLKYNQLRPHASLKYLTLAEFAATQNKSRCSLRPPPTEAVPTPDPKLSQP